MFNLITVILILCGILTESGEVYGGTEAQMRELLFAKLNSSDYSPRVRPIKDTGKSLNLTVDMYLLSINTVDEVEQKITSTAYLKLVWSDTFMTWEPNDYGNITEFSIPQDEIWKPDIALANAYESITGLGDKFMYVVVTYDGTITWEPFQRFASTCSLQMKNFPFDTHICDIQLATWSSTKEMITIMPGTDGFNIDSFEENANWNILTVTALDSSTLTTSSISFSITIRRKPIFYILNTIIPVLLLSVLNSFVFVLPCTSGEKLSFAIILFLSFAIFLLIVTEVMPKGMTTVPIVTIYLLFESVFSTVIVLVAIVQLRLHNRENKTPLPELLKRYIKTIQNIKRLVCCDMKEPVEEDENKENMQVNIHIKPVETKFQETKFSAKNEDDKKPKEKTNKSNCKTVFKRKVICGASKIDTLDDEMLDENLKNRLIHTSDKTAFRLADILGNSNRVEPEAFFTKPTQVSPLYDQNIAIEDVEGADNITQEKWETVYERFQNVDKVKRFPFIDSNSSGSETSSTKSEEKDKNDYTWSEFVLALDNTLFVVSIIMNTITTVVTFFVSMAN